MSKPNLLSVKVGKRSDIWDRLDYFLLSLYFGAVVPYAILCFIGPQFTGTRPYDAIYLQIAIFNIQFLMTKNTFIACSVHKYIISLQYGTVCEAECYITCPEATEGGYIVRMVA